MRPDHVVSIYPLLAVASVASIDLQQYNHEPLLVCFICRTTGFTENSIDKERTDVPTAALHFHPIKPVNVDTHNQCATVVNKEMFNRKCHISSPHSLQRQINLSFD